MIARACQILRPHRPHRPRAAVFNRLVRTQTPVRTVRAGRWLRPRTVEPDCADAGGRKGFPIASAASFLS